MSDMSKYIDAVNEYSYWKSQEGTMRTTPAPDLDELAEKARQALFVVLNNREG